MFQAYVRVTTPDYQYWNRLAAPTNTRAESEAHVRAYYDTKAKQGRAPEVTKIDEIVAVYYVVKVADLYELRQTRFLGQPVHAHDVCAIAHTVDEMRAMVSKHIEGAVDWTRVETSR